MDGDNRLKLIVAGLFLAAIAVGYLIFSQRFTSPSQTTSRPVVQASPTPASTPIPSPSPTTKGSLPNTGISSLPATGYPAGLIAIFSLSAALGGFFLRRYPH